MSNEKKNATLGMSHGTACNRLRKIILFDLLCRLKESICFKCGQPIEKVEELSIEHKEPWEGRSAELFWDLRNIAFSHLRCNIPHVFHGRLPQPPPEGMAWCVRCKKFEPIENFYKNASRWNGLQKYCKESRLDR